MQVSYIHKLFNDQKEEISYDLYPEEKTCIDISTKLTTNPMRFQNSKATKDVIATTSVSIKKHNLNHFHNVLTSRPQQLKDSIYNAQYLLTDADIDAIIDYYKCKTTKNNFSYVELFTSKMFLKKFKEPYKDDKIYEKYILKVLQDIHEEKNKVLNKILPVESVTEEQQHVEPHAITEEWTFTLLLGQMYKNKDHWSFKMNTKKESTVSTTSPVPGPSMKKPFWQSLQDWVLEKR